jgi:hypothetical protein
MFKTLYGISWKSLHRTEKGLLVVVVALHVFFLGIALINSGFLTDDSIQYLLLSHHWVEDGIYSQSYLPPLVPDIQRTPGYPVFLIILGNWPPLILFVQHVLVLFTAVGLARMLDRMGQPKIAKLAGWTYALLPYPMVMASLVLSETLFIFFLVMAVGLSSESLLESDKLKMLASSLFWGMAVLVRPVALPMMMVFLLVVLVAFIPDWWRKWTIPMLATVGLVFPLGWMVRNHQVSGDFIISSMGPMGMLHGRLGGLGAYMGDGDLDEHNLYMFGDSVLALKIGLAEIRTYPLEQQTHETERLNSIVGESTTEFWLQHPWKAIEFTCSRIGAMMVGVGKGWAQKVSGNVFIGWVSALVQGLFLVVLAVGCCVKIRFWRSWTSMDILLVLLVTTGLLVSAAAWSDGRYRMVLDPLLLVFSAAGLERLLVRSKSV